MTSEQPAQAPAGGPLADRVSKPEGSEPAGTPPDIELSWIQEASV